MPNDIFAGFVVDDAIDVVAGAVVVVVGGGDDVLPSAGEDNDAAADTVVDAPTACVTLVARITLTVFSKDLVSVAGKG